ncbi:hypothetical protein Scep_023407 [Stephania cephalantha]|uniref:Uncharacterized protein n=1 Tax=Stephania cephalantha TaxID=152367 RepID=A0AAP0F013_9MAGN
MPKGDQVFVPNLNVVREGDRIHVAVMPNVTMKKIKEFHLLSIRDFCSAYFALPTWLCLLCSFCST